MSATARLFSIFAVVAALTLLLAAALLSHSQLVAFIAPDATPNYKAQLSTGFIYLRILLAIDSVLLLFLFWLYRYSIVSSDLTPRSATKPVTSMPYRSPDLLIIFVLILATALRVYHANSGLWIDEYLTLVRYVRLDALYIATNFYDDNQHWLFSLLARFSISIFGESPWSLRLPAIVFGVVSVLATYMVGRNIFGRNVSLVAALLLAISYHHIWYSQNARGYTILLVGTLLSVGLLYRALIDNRYRDWVLYALCLTLCVTAHLTGVFVGIAHFVVTLFVLISKKAPISTWIKMLVGFGLAAWVTLHCFAVAIPQMASFFAGGESASGTPNIHWKSLSWAVSELFSNLGIPLHAGWLALVIGGIASAVFCWIFWRKDKLFFALATTPAIVLLLAMMLLERNLWPRLLFNMAGFVVLYLSYLAFLIGNLVLARLPHVGPVVRYLPAAVVVAAFLVGTFSVYRYPKQDFQSTYRYIDQHAGENDNIIALHMAGVIFRDIYETEWLVPERDDELSLHESESSATWVVYTLPRYIKSARPQWQAKLNSEYQLARTFKGSLGDGDILVYRKQK